MVEKPVKRVARDRKKAKSVFQCLERTPYFSFIEVVIHSGRQHQIRKHTVLAGHEIIGDRRYGDPKYQKKIQKRYELAGMCLHAHKLNVMYKGKKIELSSSVPNFWERLR